MEEKIKKTTKKTEKKDVSKSSASGNIIAVIRIDGEVKVKPKTAETLDRLRLRRKYSCILVNGSNKSLMGMLEVTKHHVAYGPIERDILEKLIKARGKKINGKFNSGDVSDEIINGKSLEELGLKPFFRLHPPRGGIKSKLNYPKGVLGNNKSDINKLVERML